MRHLFISVLLLALLGGCALTPQPSNDAGTALPEGTAEPAGAANSQEAAPPSGAGRRIPLRVFCAGSLMIPFQALEEGFEAANPDIDMLMEAHGSIQVIRHVTDIHESLDVVASADHLLLSLLMYNTNDPDTGLPYASWNIRFAANSLVLAYGPHSQGAGEITSENWTEILTRPGTRVGLADPRIDAAGYRQLMVLQLAEALYGEKTLFEDVFMGRFGQPIRALQEDGRTMIYVPEVLEPRKNSTIVMRGSSIQLIPLLESGDVDYIFEYESVVRQHGLDYIELPAEVNLGDPSLRDWYDDVAVKLDFQRFASVEPLFEGDPIAYGLTIPSNASHPEAAARFIAYLLGEQGRRTMAENYHELLEPVTVDHPDALPELLKPLCEPE